jgi:hypothetical protein
MTGEYNPDHEQSHDQQTYTDVEGSTEHQAAAYVSVGG